MALSKTQAKRMVYEAEQAAVKAANGAQPEGMIVFEADGLSNRPKPDARAYFVSGGVCGFAWVNVKPGNGRIARALKQLGGNSRVANCSADSYYGGVTAWMFVGGQSHARKCEAAAAYARVIEAFAAEAGENIRVWVGDRLD